MNIKAYIDRRPALKKWVHRLIMDPVRIRPRWFVRFFQFLYIEQGKWSVIYGSVRKDLVPFRRFKLGSCAVVESFSVVNNAVGDITIGDYSRVGIGNTVIGPVVIGDHVQIGQHVLITGINHDYAQFEMVDDKSPLKTATVNIADYVWIGANVSILPGVTIGRRAVIGAGAVVTSDIPPYTVAVGNPARVVKKYDKETKSWVKL